MPRKRFYELCDMLRPYLEKKRTRLRPSISVEAQIGSFLHYVSEQGQYRIKISKASISGIIRRVSYALTTIIGSRLIRLSTTEREDQEVTDRYLEVHGFPQCIGATDGIHKKIVKPSEHETDFINRKDYFSLNVQAVCDYKYYLQDVVIKWPDSVHNARIFLNSSINGLLRKRIIPPCENY